MITTGGAMADSVGDIFGIDSGLIFEAEIDPYEARIIRGVRGTDGHPVVTRTEDGEVDVVRVLEVFDMNRRIS